MVQGKMASGTTAVFRNAGSVCWHWVWDWWGWKGLVSGVDVVEEGGKWCRHRDRMF